MASGVFRPYSLTDVLGAINQNSNQQTTGDVINGLAGFAEVDENGTISGSMTCTHSAPPGWGQTVWGAFTWA